MISYFPAIYPDELVYSWLCRYYVHSNAIKLKPEKSPPLKSWKVA